MKNVQPMRKKISGMILLVTVFLIFLLLLSSLRGYAHTIPIIFGPLKQAMLVFLLVLLCAALDAWATPCSGRWAAAWLVIFLGVCWFVGRLLLDFLQPESAVGAALARHTTFGVLLLFAGIGLRLSICPIIFQGKLPAFTPKIRLLIGLGFVGVSLIPLLSSGFCWDDAFFSVRIPAMRVTGDSIWQRTWNEILIYVKMGRINPFATFQFMTFYLLPNAVVYKIYIVLLTLTGCWIFYKFMLQWSKNERLALGGLLIVPLCIQLRLYHDPMTGYYGLMQMMFCELFASLFFFSKFLEDGKARERRLSLLFFAIGLMSYEMFYPLLLFYPLTAWLQRGSLRKGLRDSQPFILFEVVLLAASMGLRLSYVPEGEAYSGTAFSLDPAKILRTWGRQTLGAFPLNYQLMTEDAALAKKLIPRSQLFGSSLGQFIASMRLQDWLCLGLAGCCGLSVLHPNSGVGADRKEASAKTATERWGVPLFALLLVVLPGMTIAVSEKYQEQLTDGLAYIPVYFEYFGAALLIIWLAELFRQRFSTEAGRRGFCAVCLSLFSVIYLVNMQNNRRMVELLNETFLYPRQTGEVAVQAGILGDSDATLVSNNSYYLWEHGWLREPFQESFYSLNARRPIHALGVQEFAQEAVKGKTTETVYPQDTRLIEYTGTRGNGFAKYGNLLETKIYFDRMTLKQPMASEVFYFVRGYEGLTPYLSYRTRDGVTHELAVTDGWKIRQTAEGTLYKLQEEKAVDFDSIGLVIQQ